LRNHIQILLMFFAVFPKAMTAVIHALHGTASRFW